MPSGPLPQNPSDLLAGDRLGEVLGEMEKSFDVIILDTAPILAVSDALVVGSQVDGMILVAQSGRTRSDDLRRAAAFRRGTVRIVGAAVNQERGRPVEGRYTVEAVTLPAEASGQNRADATQRPASPNAIAVTQRAYLRESTRRKPRVANKPAP